MLRWDLYNYGEGVGESWGLAKAIALSFPKRGNGEIGRRRIPWAVHLLYIHPLTKLIRYV